MGKIPVKPDIDNFINTLTLKKNHKTPVAELGIHPEIKAKHLGRPVITLADDVDFWHQAGYDYIKLQPVLDFNPGQTKRAAVPESGDTTFTWANESKGIVTNRDEFEMYLWPKVEQIDFSKFEEVEKYLPEGMGVIGQYGDIFTMAWELMGFETFSMGLFLDRELVSDIVNRFGQIVYKMFEYFAQNDRVDALWYSDDIAYQASLMISPADLDEFFFPWLKKIGDLAGQYNKPLIYHTDGILFDVMDRIIESGVSALHPIEPLAMDIVEVKKKVGDKLCLIGNIDVNLLATGTPEQVRQNVKENIEKVGRNGGYCVGSGNSVPNYAKYENFVAMVAAAKEFG